MRDKLSVILTKYKKEKGSELYRAIEDLLNSSRDEDEDFKEKFKLLYNTSQLAYQSLDVNGNITDINPAWLKITGYNKKEVIGKPFVNFIHHDLKNQFKQRFKKFIQKGKADKTLFKLKKKNGQYISVIYESCISYNKDGKFQYTFCSFTDISKEIEAQKKLKESKDKYKKLVHGQGEGIGNIDENEIFTFANSAAEKIFGVNRKGLLGRSLNDFLTPKEQEKIKKETLKRKQGKKSSYELEITDFKGVKKQILATVTPNKDENGKFVGSFGIFRNITERKKIETALKESEEKFRTIFELNTDLIGIANINTATFFKVNSAFTKTLGYTEKEFTSKPFLEFIHPGDIQKTIDVIETELKKGKTIIQFVNRYKSKNGGYRILEWKSYPVPDKGIIYAVAHDITRRTQDEQKLKESEERFKLLSEVTFEGIAIHKNGIATDCNQSFLNITGYKKEEIINQNLFDIIPERHHPSVKEKIQKHTAKPYEITIQKKDGSEIPIEIEARNFKFNNETFRVAAIRDIADRKEIQKKLLENEKKFRIYIETSPLGIFIADKNGKYKFVNSAGSKLLGYSQKELFNMRIPDIHVKEDLPEIKKIFDAVKTKGKIPAFETRFQTKKGNIIYVILESIKISEDEYIGFCTNITDRKNYEAELQELNATKDKFFSIIAHDLRGPMNNLVGFTDLLVNKYQTYNKEKLSYIINMTNSSARKTFSLLENLLIWSKSQRNKLTFKPVKLVCKEIITEIFDEMQHFAVAKQITLETLKEHDGFPVLVDKDMFKTIFRNLISNAIKFTEEGGKISIGCDKTENNMVKFYVSDTGIGIPKSKLGKLFDIGQNSTTPGTKDEQGTGLGLVLCKEFVEKHGGKIWAESFTNNKKGAKKNGSTFYFTIPLAGK